MKTFDLGAVTAYALAVKHGFEGTEAEWVAHMQANATQATGAEANAKQYAANAKTSETNAGKSATNAQTAATNAATSAQNAAKSAEEAKKAKGIKTVNGKTPDENGNVEIDSVASWNDLTDKPFGEESGMVELLSECTPTYDENEGGFVAEKLIELKDGEHYTVTLNGVDYPSTATDFGDEPILANDGANFETGENVVFIIFAGYEYTKIQLANGSTDPITISIKQEQTITKTLDPKYLPDGVPYVVDGDLVEVMAETTLTTDDPGDFQFDENIAFELGTTYLVKWNGTDYTCVAQDLSVAVPGAVGLGDLTTMGMSGNGEPFSLIYVPGNMTAAMANESIAEVTVSIHKYCAIVHKLDNRCLDLAWLPSATKEVAVSAEVSTNQAHTIGGGGTTILFEGYSGTEELIVNHNLVHNQKVTLIVDNVEYDAVVYATDAGTMMLPSNYDLTDPATQFFADGTFAVELSETTVKLYHTVYGRHTVGIYAKTYNTMPADFLPTDATVFHLTSPNGTKFAVTVADDGTLSASAVTE